MKFQKALISRGIFCKNLRCNHDQQASSTRQIIVMLYQIWYHLYDLKNEKSSHGEASLNKAATLLKITLFHRFHVLKIAVRYQIAQSITFSDMKTQSKGNTTTFHRGCSSGFSISAMTRFCDYLVALPYTLNVTRDVHLHRKQK